MVCPFAEPALTRTGSPGHKRASAAGCFAAPETDPLPILVPHGSADRSGTMALQQIACSSQVD